MGLPREYISHLAGEMARGLEKSGKVKVHDKAAAAGKLQQVLEDDVAQEERLNQEVREYLEKYSDQIRRDAISYQEMYKLVKKELQKKYRMVPSRRPEPGGAKLSRDKVIELSHRMIRELSQNPFPLELLQEANEVRLEIVRQFQMLLKQELHIDQAARQKITSQKREIAEGSGEWDILYRKYYSEEMRKLGVG